MTRDKHTQTDGCQDIADCVSEEANVSWLARNSTDNHISCTHVNNQNKTRLVETEQDKCPLDLIHGETHASIAQHNR